MFHNPVPDNVFGDTSVKTDIQYMIIYNYFYSKKNKPQKSIITIDFESIIYSSPILDIYALKKVL